MSLSQQFAAYSQWRSRLAACIGSFQLWLSENELSDAQTVQRLGQLLDGLRDDRLNVAFVAEFSRGKSELINAIFFAEYGNRMLPSSAGRTTMCPTELLYDPAKTPRIELLPIKTRTSNASVTEYKRFPDEWHVVDFDIASAEAMQEALHHVSETLRMTPDDAAKLGFEVGDDGLDVYRVGDDGLVEVPRWRHALINFPHPLLQQGLVILDTPGLNAVGSEPELTLSLLPNAHAVLFILAADTGVTQSDLVIWKKHIGDGGASKRNRMVVLNKIDGQWDELKTAEEIAKEIQKQIDSCADILDLPPQRIYPVSAQKGLVGKINGDSELLARSRLPELEAALSNELIPGKQDIVRENTEIKFGEVSQDMLNLLESRIAGLRDQLTELNNLRGKSRSVIEYMMGKARTEKDDFEAGLQRYNAVRSVLSSLTNQLFAQLRLENVNQLSQETRTVMNKARFSKGLSAAIAEFFQQSRQSMHKSHGQINEILSMLGAMYKKFSVEHGLKLDSPTAFSLLRHEKEIDRVEQWCNVNFKTTTNLLTVDRENLSQRFFDQVAVHVRRVFERANADAEIWLKAVISPMETQVREHQIQLKRRLESIKRIHQATSTLEERIAELMSAEKKLVQQIQEIDTIAAEMHAILEMGNSELKAA